MGVVLIRRSRQLQASIRLSIPGRAATAAERPPGPIQGRAGPGVLNRSTDTCFGRASTRESWATPTRPAARHQARRCVPDLLSWAGSARHRVFGCLDERFLRSCPGAPAISLSTSTRQPRCPLSLDCTGLLTNPSVRAGTSARSYRGARDRYASCEPLTSDSRCEIGISMDDFGMAATSGNASAGRDRSDDPAALLDRPSELPCGRTAVPSVASGG